MTRRFWWRNHQLINIQFIGLFLSVGLFFEASWLLAQPEAAKLFRYPDVSSDRILFSYGGNIWTVPISGGQARQLTSSRGYEVFGKFSPDGRQVAFSGNYDGNVDVFTIPVEGGVPVRLTYHPGADYVVDWDPNDGTVLFKSSRESPSRYYRQLYKTSPQMRLPRKLPLQYGETASYEPGGTRLAFQPHDNQFQNWKGYRGGKTDQLFLYDFTQNTATALTPSTANYAVPMWTKSALYFISDRDDSHRFNLWKYTFDTETYTQLTFYTDADVRWPSLGPTSIVYVVAGELHVFDLNTESDRPVFVTVSADLPEFRDRFVDVTKWITSYGVSPRGHRAYFEARGDIYTVPKKEGPVYNLTRTSGIAERFPAWSPNGRHMAYFSDRSGEYQLTLLDLNTRNETALTAHTSGFYYTPIWSPDSKKIVYASQSGELWLLDISGISGISGISDISDKASKKKAPVLVDRDEWGILSDYRWSPDSGWIVYSKTDSNQMKSVYVYDVASRKSTRITSSDFEDGYPVFDPKGRYVYFYSNRMITPAYDDLVRDWVFSDTTGLYAVALRKDVPSLIRSKSDEEPVVGVSSGTKSSVAAPKSAKSKKKAIDAALADMARITESVTVRIDFDGILDRVERLASPGNVAGMVATDTAIYYIETDVSGSASRDGDASGSGASLIQVDLTNELKKSTVLEGVSDVLLSADGTTLMYRSGRRYGLAKPSAKLSKSDGLLTVKLETTLTPQDEWRQIFNEAWRLQRDFFYDPNLHGTDWVAIKQQYAPLLDYVRTRGDLNTLIGEMVSHLNASHLYVSGGDHDEGDTVSVGLLGCDFEYDASADVFRISRIYRGLPGDPKTQSGLVGPGLTVSTGDVLLEVNHQPLSRFHNPYDALQGLDSGLIQLTLNDKASHDGSRSVYVTPLKSEYLPRYYDWVASNHAYVTEKSNGEVGYVYVPDTSSFGVSEFMRQFMAESSKKGLIIDERFNGGGQVPYRMIELLNRPVLNYWGRRGFYSSRTPALAHDGPKAMLINQWSGSGGDAFPYYFKKLQLGPLIGTTTWGGLIGYTATPKFIDGGELTAPSFAFWNSTGSWEIEGTGVASDIQVENSPLLLGPASDNQLNTAIDVVSEKVRVHAPSPIRPPYPDRSLPR